jgi:hypothetical protein
VCIVCNNPPPQLRKVTIWRVREDGLVVEDNDAWVWACCPEHDGLLCYVGGLRMHPSIGDFFPWANPEQPGYHNKKAEAYLTGAVITGRLKREYERRWNEYHDIADKESTKP